jgi:hypothetical protein
VRTKQHIDEVSTAEKIEQSVTPEDASALSYYMEFTERRKKSDKAKDKAGKPSQKHVRQYEALMATRAASGTTTNVVEVPKKK